LASFDYLFGKLTLPSLNSQLSTINYQLLPDRIVYASLVVALILLSILLLGFIVR